jgi:hypothetical protein
MSQSTWTLTHTTKLVTEDCYLCGITFAMPVDYQEHRLRKRDTFYCPNGHSQHYTGETDKQKAERLARQLANREEDLRSERASHAATKGHLTRARQREAAGVCPQCHRSFAQVRRHMERMHPDFVTEHLG